jgi:hypothetical protein
MRAPTDVQLAASRRRLNIPDDWVWYECANECGDIVWCAPGAIDDRMSLPVKPTCSASCAFELMGKL